LWQYRYSNELYHHGIKGQKWGVRRFQNPDGSLTEEGKKRLAGNKSVYVESGVKLNRVSGPENASRLKKGVYVTADTKEQDKFTMAIALGHIRKGKAFINKYVSEDDLRIPSVKTQNKIARKIMKDEDVRKELADTMASKGYSETQIKAALSKHEVGTSAVAGLLAGTFGGASLGFLAMPIHPIGAVSGAVMGGLIGTIAGIKSVTGNNAYENSLGLKMFYNSIGDDRNSATYKQYAAALKSKGYNAIRDLNDKNNSLKSHSALVVMDSSSLNKKGQIEITKQAFVDATVRRYKETHPSITREDSLDPVRKMAEQLYNGAVKVRGKKSKAA